MYKKNINVTVDIMVSLPSTLEIIEFKKIMIVIEGGCIKQRFCLFLQSLLVAFVRTKFIHAFGFVLCSITSVFMVFHLKDGFTLVNALVARLYFDLRCPLAWKHSNHGVSDLDQMAVLYK